MTNTMHRPPPDTAQLILLCALTASGLHRAGPGVRHVAGGFDVQIGGVTQRFRCYPVPRSMEAGRLIGVATSESDQPWRWSVETSVALRSLHRLALGADAVRGYHARFHAGIAKLDGDRLLLRAHVTSFEPHDFDVVTLLGPVARWQRVVARGGDLDAESIGASPIHGPCSAYVAAQLDTAVEAFGDVGVIATHALQRGAVRVRFPWSTRMPCPADELEGQSVLRAELGSDVRIDVRAAFTTLGPGATPGALVETHLPVPNDVGAAEAERWTERLNAAEIDAGAAGPAIGAWSLAMSESPGCRRVWIHRCVFQSLCHGPPWSLIADLALRRVRWAVRLLGEHYYRHEAEVRPWSGHAPKVTLQQFLYGTSRLYRRWTQPSRMVPQNVPIISIASHLWACARARRTGPWLEHVARVERRGASQGSAGRERIVERLCLWMQEYGAVPDAETWRWSLTGTVDAPVGAPEPYHRRLPDADVRNLLAHAEANDVAVAWRTSLWPGVLGFATQQQRRGGVRSERPPFVRSRTEGYVRVPLGRFVVAVDAATHAVPHAEVLVHELAHVLLGHTGSPFEPTRPAVAPRGRRSLGVMVAEAEVSMVVILVFGRRGVRPDESIVRLVAFLDAARRHGQDADIDLWHVFAAAERLLAWCVDRPDATTVTSPRRAPLPLGGLARTVQALDEVGRAGWRARTVVPERVES